jgi:small conductance mechanosensitive channel
MQVMREVADDLRADPKFSSVILQPLEVSGIDSFTDSNIIIKSRIKTLPLKQWDTGRELRRRLMKRFATEGIKFPQRQLVLHMVPAEEERFRALTATRADSSNAEPVAPKPSSPPK